MAQAELEQALSELLAVGAAADADALDLEDLAERDADRAPLGRRQLLRSHRSTGWSPVASA